MQLQLTEIMNYVQSILPLIRANIVILTAIILVLLIWILKSQIVRQNRRFLLDLKKEWKQQNQQVTQSSMIAPTSSGSLKSSLLEQKILVYQTLVNLKNEMITEQQNLFENGLTAKRYYHYFKEFRDIVIHSRFYLASETEFTFSQMMQDSAPQLLKIKHLENEFAEQATLPSTDRYALEKLIEQETVVLETFHQNSRVQMIHFLDMIDDDAAKLRTELNF